MTTPDATSTPTQSVAESVPTVTPPKKEVSPELLARLAKAREAKAEKRRIVQENKAKADAFLKQQASKAKSQPVLEKSYDADSDSDDVSEDSSVSSSDSSDSEIEVPNKRGKARKVRKPKTKQDLSLILKAEVEKAREKYKARYKSRYESKQAHDSPPKVTRQPVHNATASGSEEVKRQVKNVAKHDLSQALNRELVQTAMKNLFGV